MIYRPCTNHPTLTTNKQFQQFAEILSNILNDFSNSNVQVLLFGDFNLDALKYNIINQVTEYIDLLFSFGFLQIVMRPTRCTPSSAKIIDHILTNQNGLVHESVIFLSKLSDHFPIFYFGSTVQQKIQNPIHYFRDFSSQNITAFANNIHAFQWADLMEIQDVQEAYNHFSKKFFLLYNIHFPLLKKRINRNSSPLNL